MFELLVLVPTALLFFFALTILLAHPLASHLVRVYATPAVGPWPALHRLEAALYRLAGVDPAQEMTWRTYAGAVVVFHVLGIAGLFLIQQLQGSLPLNPEQLPAVAPGLALNTAISFVTNTNWQSYSGEQTLSTLTQMVGLTVQNFLSAALGLAVLAALVRGLVRRESQTLGNFWVDLTRGILYVLLPLSLLLAPLLVQQGVPQAFTGSVRAGGDTTVQLGPIASQVAIKQLGTNGGGYFNANAAHPLENTSPLSNGLQMLAMILLPVASCLAFGQQVGNRRQGWAILAAMLLLLLPAIGLSWAAEARPPRLGHLATADCAAALAAGPQWEGKEARLGPREGAIWAALTTGTATGSVNAMHDSFTPLGGLVPLVLMQLGEVALGGAGSGLYGMLIFLICAVFLAGLMVGRTPEYLGKKINPFEMQMSVLAIVLPSAALLLGTVLACTLPAGLAGRANPGAHGFTEILYAFTSAASNNGSAFAGLTATHPLYTWGLGLTMLVGRLGVMLPVLAIAGSLAQQRPVPVGPGTLATDTPQFVLLLVSVVIVLGALTFVPTWALGPIADHLVLP